MDTTSQNASAGARAKPSVLELSITDIQQAYAAKKYTAEELTRAFLDRIAQYEPSYNAFVTMNPSSLDDAKEIDRRLASGDKLGPLAGVPVVIKEAIDVAGLPSTAGWEKLSSRAGGVDLIPATDAPVVTRLRAAGAIILGKTNIPAFSDDGTRANTSWDGPTRNAVNPDLAPGGSSSGTATAVSASFAVIGLAEETGGSIQNPAAAQSLVSVKPTFGLVPNTGVAPLAGSTRDVVGPHAKTVRDAAIVLDMLAGYTPEDPKTIASFGNIPDGGYAAGLSETALKGKRIGLYGRGWRNEDLSDGTKKLYGRGISELEARGAIVLSDPFAGSGFADLALPGVSYDPRGMESAAYDLEQYLRRLGPNTATGSVAELVKLIGENPFEGDGYLAWYGGALPELKASISDPTKVPDLSSFRALREKHLRIFNKVMEEKDLDALVFPQMTKPVPPLFSDESYSATTVSEINITGVPSVSVPAGIYKNGSPFSLIFIGRLWDEANLLAMAFDYEQATKHRIVPKLVVTPVTKDSAQTRVPCIARPPS
ncbi:amidase [Bradyrhizobium valentinum]|uniref:amidase n=1 Tax=Bradyrhizobium valentinum TaxID=1518501 RepID=UPI0007C695CC|nr:amidase [Bradyrhizobium valentinum]